MPVVEYPPPAALARFVDAFWARAPGSSVTAAGGAEPERILPDGCLDVVVGPRQAIVVGAMTGAIVVPSIGFPALIGVRFRPGMATAFLGVPAVELTDGQAPLEDVWADGAAVADRVGSALGTDRAVARLAAVLTARLPGVAPVPADLTAAVEHIVARSGRTGVARLSASLGVTRQHLARRFAAYVGVSPKTLCRVVRLRTLLHHHAAAGGRTGWARLAADLGYSDQSHLVAEFRSLTGLTPSRWLAARIGGSKTPSRLAAGAL
jgi:AraC-like DNA-binding protein